jgi:hypothetical protein
VYPINRYADYGGKNSHANNGDHGFSHRISPFMAFGSHIKRRRQYWQNLFFLSSGMCACG